MIRDRVPVNRLPLAGKRSPSRAIVPGWQRSRRSAEKIFSTKNSFRAHAPVKSGAIGVPRFSRVGRPSRSMISAAGSMPRAR